MEFETNEKLEISILKQIQKDLSFLKQKIVIIEEELDAISSDMHVLRPEYITKLREIEEKGEFYSFKNIDEMKKAIET